MPPPILRRLTDRIGVRAALMILASILWCLIGLQVILEPPPATPPASVLYYLLPPAVRVALWVGTGLIGLTLSLSVRRSDWGLAALCVAPIERAVSWVWSWLMYIVPGTPPGDPRGWFAGLVWTLVALLPIVMSHVPAHVHRERR